MTLEQQKNFDHFFLVLFNQLLVKEEQLIQKKYSVDLTIRELHVIEAVDTLSKTGQNTMACISKQLFITPGTLTSAVNQLIQKNYLTKHSSPSDKRVVLVELTEKGKKGLSAHRFFHKELGRFIQHEIAPDRMDSVLSSLERVHQTLGEKIRGISEKEEETLK
ncbi:MAG: MarR family transcriptional regulator [Clostridia bacterium]|nr:MarR family transcriptional regulator [Clostridia bacterium]